MDESTDGSSSAAQGAQPEGHSESDETGGFFRRVIGIFNPGEDIDEIAQDDGEYVNGAPGIGNLRHMAVEDVAPSTPARGGSHG